MDGRTYFDKAISYELKKFMKVTIGIHFKTILLE
jgi:hypothetical protein